MLAQDLRTFFDTPDRQSAEETYLIKNRISGNNLLFLMIEASPRGGIVLNMEKQIVAFNRKAAYAIAPFR